MNNILPTFFAHGSLTFFTGPVACGKTLELVRHLQIFREQQVPLVCIRPSLDTRTPAVQSRSGLLHDAIAVNANSFAELRDAVEDKQVIGIDEVQFFPIELAELLERELRKNKTILVSGLDTDFRGHVFPTAHAIMALPETNIQRSRAVCSVCHQYNATRTQRLRNGEPSRANEPTIIIEGSQETITYEARCLAHHEVG